MCHAQRCLENICLIRTKVTFQDDTAHYLNSSQSLTAIHKEPRQLSFCGGNWYIAVSWVGDFELVRGDIVGAFGRQRTWSHILDTIRL